MGSSMEFKMRLFLNERPLAPGDYGRVIIASPAIDRIVNDIYNKSVQIKIQTSDTNSTSDEDHI